MNDPTNSKQHLHMLLDTLYSVGDAYDDAEFLAHHNALIPVLELLNQKAKNVLEGMRMCCLCTEVWDGWSFEEPMCNACVNRVSACNHTPNTEESRA